MQGFHSNGRATNLPGVLGATSRQSPICIHSSKASNGEPIGLCREMHNAWHAAWQAWWSLGKKDVALGLWIEGAELLKQSMMLRHLPEASEFCQVLWSKLALPSANSSLESPSRVPRMPETTLGSRIFMESNTTGEAKKCYLRLAARQAEYPPIWPGTDPEGGSKWLAVWMHNRLALLTLLSGSGLTDAPRPVPCD